ncbi:MAG: hypothetical protein GYB68_15505 [Chloroflexi bacterium]|nr:hypothetical protein [Chloroflexota bacterium]
MTKHQSPIHDYIELNEHFYAVYERAEVRAGLLAELAERLPQAHMVISCRYTCPDCARNVPRMARIAEYLPGWTWNLYDSTANPIRNEQLHVRRVPTFILYDQVGGSEIGRIIENPTYGSLEQDLLTIVQAHADAR